MGRFCPYWVSGPLLCQVLNSETSLAHAARGHCSDQGLSVEAAAGEGQLLEQRELTAQCRFHTDRLIEVARSKQGISTTICLYSAPNSEDELHRPPVARRCGAAWRYEQGRACVALGCQFRGGREQGQRPGRGRRRERPTRSRGRRAWGGASRGRAAGAR